MKTIDKIIRAKIKLQHTNPFFSFLVMRLKMIEEPKIETMGVDINGNCYFNPKFIDNLSEEEMIGVLTHEVCHLAFEHLPLVKKYKEHHQIANVSADIAINYILLKNNLVLPKLAILPNVTKNEVKLNNGSVVIKDLDNKAMKEIYYELLKKLPTTENKTDSFDTHFTDGIPDENGNVDDDENEKEKNETGKNKFTNKSQENTEPIDWKKAMVEAYTYSKLQGNLPLGMERLVDDITTSKLNWRGLLHRFITAELPSDYTYRKPSNKSIMTPFYLPSLKKENMNITIALDTSGSVSNKDLGTFLGEMIGMAKSSTNMNMDVVCCDTEVYEAGAIRNGNIQKIKELKISGGGGTELTEIYTYLLDKKNRRTKPNLLIIFTDGETDFPEKETIKTIWVLTKDGINPEDIPFGKVIKM